MFHVEHAVTDLMRLTGIDLSTDQIASFDFYLRELQEWNAKTNLTAIDDRDEIIVKHFVDSMLSGQALFRKTQRTTVLDVGSGAGFPGIPLKIACPELHVTLLEPNQKKISFLRHMVGSLALEDVKVVSKTLQEISSLESYSHSFHNVISRAFNVLASVHFCRPLLNKEGRVILCRSKSLGHTIPSFTLNELSYELPAGYGSRVLSILIPNESSTWNKFV